APVSARVLTRTAPAGAKARSNERPDTLASFGVSAGDATGESSRYGVQAALFGVRVPAAFPGPLGDELIEELGQSLLAAARGLLQPRLDGRRQPPRIDFRLGRHALQCNATGPTLPNRAD